jgi:predicted ATP-grasp superfamily ATP-dependent carboligase
MKESVTNDRIPVVIGALNLMRCFGMERVPFYAVTSSGNRRVYYSRYCQKGFSIGDPNKDIKVSMSDLKKILNEIGTGHPFFFDKDGHLKMVSTYYDEISGIFNVVLPPKEIICMSLDKNSFYDYAVQKNWPIPPTYNLQEFKRNSDFPVVLKPATRVDWHIDKVVKELDEVPCKALIVGNSKELDHFTDSFRKSDIEFVLQRYIAGPESNVLSFHSFFTRESKPLGYFVGKKIRTFPVVGGDSSYLQLIKYDDLSNRVIKMSLEILRSINYVGPIKIDYKWDKERDQIYLLEINPRNNLWNYLGAVSGINLPYLAYRYCVFNEANEVKRDYRTNYRWIHCKKDYHAFLSLWKKREISPSRWLRSLCFRKVYNTFSWKDLKPMVYVLIDSFRGFFRKTQRVLFISLNKAFNTFNHM